MGKLYGTGEVARMLGVSETVLQHLLRRQPDLEPQAKVSGSRAWTGEEVERARARRASKIKVLVRVYDPDETWATGDIVDHPKFGRGVVAKADARKLEVLFPDGPRTLTRDAKPKGA